MEIIRKLHMSDFDEAVAKVDEEGRNPITRKLDNIRLNTLIGLICIAGAIKEGIKFAVGIPVAFGAYVPLLAARKINLISQDTLESANKILPGLSSIKRSAAKTFRYSKCAFVSLGSNFAELVCIDTLKFNSSYQGKQFRFRNFIKIS